MKCQSFLRLIADEDHGWVDPSRQFRLIVGRRLEVADRWCRCSEPWRERYQTMQRDRRDTFRFTDHGCWTITRRSLHNRYRTTLCLNCKHETTISPIISILRGHLAVSSLRDQCKLYNKIFAVRSGCPAQDLSVQIRWYLLLNTITTKTEIYITKIKHSRYSISFSIFWAMQQRR